MERKRGAVIPIGEVITDLPGSVRRSAKHPDRRSATSPKPIR